MKRFNTLVLILGLAAFMAVSFGVFAQDIENVRPERPSFVDEDGDGICDNYIGEYGGRGMGVAGVTFVDEDGDGICDNYDGEYGGRGMGGTGDDFVDEDGDGVCDNNIVGQGRRNGRHGANRASVFVDEDGDGVCDNGGAGIGRLRSRGRMNSGAQKRPGWFGGRSRNVTAQN